MGEGASGAETTNWPSTTCKSLITVVGSRASQINNGRYNYFLLPDPQISDSYANDIKLCNNGWNVVKPITDFFAWLCTYMLRTIVYLLLWLCLESVQVLSVKLHVSTCRRCSYFHRWRYEVWFSYNVIKKDVCFVRESWLHIYCLFYFVELHTCQIA